MEEVLLDTLAAGDVLVFGTRSSQYSLEMVDPKRRVARLTRVSDGRAEAPREVYLWGAHTDDVTTSWRIRTGTSLVYSYPNPFDPEARLKGQTSHVTWIGLGAGAGRSGGHAG